MILQSKNFNINFLENSDFNTSKNIITDNSINTFYTLKNYSGKDIGLISLQIDFSKENAIVESAILNDVILAFTVITIILILLNIIIHRIVIKPMKKLSYDIKEIAKGKLIEKLDDTDNNIIGSINAAFNIMLTRLKITTNFANQIGKGKLDVTIDNVGKDDILVHALINMKNNLVEANETEKQNKIEESKRNWATKGFANFSEILRHNNDNIEEFSSNIITNLVKYTNSNQGGLFILNDDNKQDIFLDLTAAYAYDRKKYVDKQIKFGEGLVGTCAIEKETIFITDIPENYLNITSGLGNSNPRTILIVPLKIEGEIFGIIELASFTVYEKYQIDFIEKLAESIASSLSVAKINQITNELLSKSQEQSEILSAQEEELRQNLEEMQATQEESSKRESEKTSLIEALNNTAFVVEFDLEANIIDVNDAVLKKFGFSSKEQIIGFNHRNFYSEENYDEKAKLLWGEIQQKQIVTRKEKLIMPNREIIWLKETYSPILQGKLIL